MMTNTMNTTTNEEETTTETQQINHITLDDLDKRELTDEELNTIADQVVSSQEFNDALEEATPLKIKIMTDYKNDLKDVQTEWLKFMAESDPKVSKAMSSKKKTQDEKKLIAEFKKSESKKFNDVRKILHPGKKANGEPNDPIGKLVEKLTSVAQILKYIGRTDLEDRLAEAGITLEVPDLESTNPYFAQPNSKGCAQALCMNAESIQTKICDTNDKVRDEIFEKIKEESHIKPAHFSKLVLTKATSELKNNEKFDKYKTKQLKKTEADVLAGKITYAMTKTIA